MSKPRVLFVNRTTYDLPLDPALAAHWDALSERLEVRVIARQGQMDEPDERFRLLRSDSKSLGGRAFYIKLLPRVRREIRDFRPHVLTTQSPYEAFACLSLWPLLKERPKLLVQIHGDWRTASRLYGSPLRRAFAPVTDWAAETALRRADGTRAVGPFTARLAREITGEEPIASYPTHFDQASFRRKPVQPLPETPAVAWVGVLERTKNLDGFIEAWRLVAREVPEARLTIVGEGRLRPLVDDLVRDFTGQVTAIPRLAPEAVSDLLDASTLLAIPSRSEGAPRVILEAFVRGRPVIGARVGGIPDRVRDDGNGLLIDPEAPDELAAAIVRVLSDRELAGRLASGAREDAAGLDWTPERLAGALADVLDVLIRSKIASDRK